MNTREGKIKVILLQEVLPPYRVGLFNAIAKNENIELTVILFSSGTANKPEWDDLSFDYNFELIVLRGWHLRLTHERFLHINYNLWYKLLKIKPDIIINGGFYLSTIQSVLLSKYMSIPLLIWSESTIYSDSRASAFKKWMRKWMLKQANAYITAGRLAYEYLEVLYMQKLQRPNYTAYNSIDVKYYHKTMQLLEKDSHIRIMKKKYGEKIVLFVGQLLKRKGVWETLKAYQEVYQKNNDVALILLGSGPEQDELIKYCSDNHLVRVYFEGFVQQEEAVKFFAIADLFLLLSHYDCNPLVILEALACGLPIVASYQVGNTPEFVQNGKNGFVVDNQDINQIAEKVLQILAETESSYGEHSLELSRKVTHTLSALVFHDAIINTVQSG